MEPHWLGESNGNYSVRSTYMTFKQIADAEVTERIGEISDKINQTRFWRKNWRLKIQEKVKIFFWKLHNFVPVGWNLQKKGCQNTIHCFFCKYREETTSHVFLDCWWAKAFWRYHKIDHLIYPWRNTDMSGVLWQCVSCLTKEDLILFIYGIYKIWYCRNLMAHVSESSNIEVAALNTTFKVNTILEQSFKFMVISDEAGFSWNFSGSSEVIIQCDASWFSETKKNSFWLHS